jgi:hypothetical protein
MKPTACERKTFVVIAATRGGWSERAEDAFARNY